MARGRGEGGGGGGVKPICPCLLARKALTLRLERAAILIFNPARATRIRIQRSKFPAKQTSDLEQLSSQQLISVPAWYYIMFKSGILRK